MNIIDGKKLSLEIRTKLKEKITKLDFTPGLGVILVGNNPSSHLYVRLKEKACAEVGIRFEKKIFSENAKQNEIITAIQQYNRRKDIQGILVQIPLPKSLDTDKIIFTIDPKKDVDGFHPVNLLAMRDGRANIVPGVALGILKLIESTNLPLNKKKKAVLLVNSKILETPLDYLLPRNRGIDVQTVLNPQQSGTFLKSFDIIIIALGIPKFLTSDMVKDGAVIIDVGTNIIDGKTVGDVDFESFRNREVWLTPVPGGVGPMTVAMLLQNVYNLAKK